MARSWVASFKHRLRSGCMPILRLDFTGPTVGIYRVHDNSALTGSDSVTITTDSGAEVLNATTDWAIGATAADTATNIAAAFNGTGSRDSAACEAIGPNVFLYSRRGNSTFTLAESSTGIDMPAGASPSATSVSWLSADDFTGERSLVILDCEPFEQTLDPLSRATEGMRFDLRVQRNAHTKALRRQMSFKKLEATLYLGAWYGTGSPQTSGDTPLWEKISELFIEDLIPDPDSPGQSYRLHLYGALTHLREGKLYTGEVVNVHPLELSKLCITNSDLPSGYFNTSSFATTADPTKGHFTVSRWVDTEDSTLIKWDANGNQIKEPVDLLAIHNAMMTTMGGMSRENEDGEIEYVPYSRTGSADFTFDESSVADVEPDEGVGPINNVTIEYCGNASGENTRRKWIVQSEASINELGTQIDGGLELEWVNAVTESNTYASGSSLNTDPAAVYSGATIYHDSTAFGLLFPQRYGFCGTRIEYDGTGNTSDPSNWNPVDSVADIDSASGRLAFVEWSAPNMVIKNDSVLKSYTATSPVGRRYARSPDREVLAIQAYNPSTIYSGIDNEVAAHLSYFGLAGTLSSVGQQSFTYVLGDGVNTTCLTALQAQIDTSYSSLGFTNGRGGLGTGNFDTDPVSGRIPFAWVSYGITQNPQGERIKCYDVTIPHYRSLEILQRFEYEGGGLRVRVPLHFGEVELGDKVNFSSLPDIDIGRREGLDTNVVFEVTSVKIDPLGDSPGVHLGLTFLRDDGPLPPPLTLTPISIDPGIVTDGVGSVTPLEPVIENNGDIVYENGGPIVWQG